MRHAILVAGGTGSRMGAQLPKQFVLLHGVPVLGRTLQRFHAFDPAIRLTVVIHPDFIGYWAEQAEAFALPEHRVVAGGETRFHSVRNGLEAIVAPVGIVAVHDAVRIFPSDETLQRCFDAAQTYGSAVPVVPVVDSMLREEQGEWSHVDRSKHVAVQTPQCFTLDILRRAYLLDYDEKFTDDASVARAAGFPITVVEGNRENFKLTTPFDLLVAEQLLRT